MNHGQQPGPSISGRQSSTNSGTGTNPPAGLQKKLNQQARNQDRRQKDRSQDKCLKCGQVGHWARDCTSGANGSVNSTTVTTIVPETTQNWTDTSIISSVSTSSKSTEEYDFSRAQHVWPKLTDSNPRIQLRPKSKI